MWPLDVLFSYAPDDARRRILAGKGRRNMRIAGALDLSNCQKLASLPPGIEASAINLSWCRALRSLPAGLKCRRLDLRRCSIEHLPGYLKAAEIDASDCVALRSLDDLTVETLILRGCTSLERLPEGLKARQLDLERCRRLQAIPAVTARHVMWLNLNRCGSLRSLPARFGRLEALDVSDCVGLEELPMGIRIRLSIEVGGTPLRTLPDSLRGTQILWRGVPVSRRIVLEPETIKVDEVLRERNTALRQVLLDRMGLARFVEMAGATTIETDHDSGGPRRLLRIAVAGNEDIVCVQVTCPSTGKIYLLRVPPTMATCQQAIAWTAGFNDPRAYVPLEET